VKFRVSCLVCVLNDDVSTCSSSGFAVRHTEIFYSYLPYIISLADDSYAIRELLCAVRKLVLQCW
jgi:hypothetical protein